MPQLLKRTILRVVLELNTDCSVRAIAPPVQKIIRQFTFQPVLELIFGTNIHINQWGVGM
ncbi:MAG: hypothetical protein ABGX40_04455 [Methylococcales bacterium]